MIKKKRAGKNKSRKKNEKKVTTDGTPSDEVKRNVEGKPERKDEEAIEVTLMFLPYRTKDEMLKAKGVKQPKG